MDDDPANPLPYLQAAALAQVVVDAFVAGDHDCLARLFDRLEELLSRGPTEDHELLVVGFLEDLQGTIGLAKVEAAPFYAWFGTRSRAAWDDLLRSWENVRTSKSSQPPGRADPLPDVKDPKLKKLLRGLFRPPK